jgi:polar amino acid transport system substrate-binding protein
MRVLVLLLLLLPGTAAAQTCTPKLADAELVTPHTLTMSTNPTLPPMQYTDQSGTLKGMRVELGTEIARRLCLTPEFIKVEFAAMIPGLAAKRWDMIDTGMFFTAERARIVQLVRYEQQAISLSVVRGNPLKISAVADLAGHAAGVEQGGFEFARTRDMAAEVAKLGGKQLEIRPFDNFALAFQALRAGQVDAVVSIDSTAKEYQNRGDFTQAASGLYGTPIAFGFGSKPLAGAVAEALTTMRADGSFDKLLSQYGVKPWDGAFEVAGP